MARGRIFSSRRMFSTRRDAFAEPSRNAGPLGVVLGLTAAGIIIFAIGIFVGSAYPGLFVRRAPAPLASVMPSAQSLPTPLTSAAPAAIEATEPIPAASAPTTPPATQAP